MHALQWRHVAGSHVRCTFTCACARVGKQLPIQAFYIAAQTTPALRLSTPGVLWRDASEM